MALIKCPDCGKEISDTAPTCIGCGKPMQIVPKPTDQPPSAVPKEEPSSPPLSLEEKESRPAVFKDMANLTKWTRWLIYALICLTGIVMISGGFEYRLLVDFENGVYFSESRDTVIAVIAANDTRQYIFWIALFIVYVAAAITMLRWVYQANSNARHLGATGMRFTPGWSVVWFMIPIANLWKPYQVLKEICNASYDRAGWKDRVAPILLKWWWFAYILNVAFIVITRKMTGIGIATGRTKSMNDLFASNIINTISNILLIPHLLLLIAIITKIYETQTYAYGSALSDSLVSSRVERQKEEVTSFKYLAAFFVPIAVALVLVGFMTYQSGLFQKDVPPEARRNTQAFPAKEEAKPEADIFDIIEPEEPRLTDDERR